MVREQHIPSHNTLWALLIGLAIFAVLCPASGHFVGDTKVGGCLLGWLSSNRLTVCCKACSGKANSPRHGLRKQPPAALHTTHALCFSTNPTNQHPPNKTTQIPKVWALMAFTGVLAVATMPVFAVFQTGNRVGLWMLLPLMLGLTGLIGGVMTTIGPQIYPPAVRASGYNLGHNL